MQKIPLLTVIILILGLSTFGLWKWQTQPSQSVSLVSVGITPHPVAVTTPEPTPTPEPSMRLISVGDIMLSRDVAKKLLAHGNDYAFAKTSEYLASADMVFANLETPISEGRVIQTSEMTFRSNPGVEAAMAKAGITMVSLANNHTMNFGAKGLLDTFALLDSANIHYVGAGKDDSEAYAPVYETINGLRLAFLAYNDSDVVPASYKAAPNHPGTAFMDKVRLVQGVAEAKTKADVVLVSMHSGTEYKPTPNTSQTSFAHAAIDAGADMVIGHHPHVVQTAELYKGKPILYSLGNFIFDQMWSADTRRGMAANATITPKGVQKIEFQPVLISDYSQPSLLDGADGDAVLQRLGLELTDKTWVLPVSP